MIYMIDINYKYLAITKISNNNTIKVLKAGTDVRNAILHLSHNALPKSDEIIIQTHSLNSMELKITSMLYRLLKPKGFIITVRDELENLTDIFRTEYEIDTATIDLNKEPK